MNNSNNSSYQDENPDSCTSKEQSICDTCAVTTCEMRGLIDKDKAIENKDKFSISKFIISLIVIGFYVWFFCSVIYTVSSFWRAILFLPCILIGAGILSAILPYENHGSGGTEHV